MPLKDPPVRTALPGPHRVIKAAVILYNGSIANSFAENSLKLWVMKFKEQGHKKNIYNVNQTIYSMLFCVDIFF